MRRKGASRSPYIVPWSLYLKGSLLVAGGFIASLGAWGIAQIGRLFEEEEFGILLIVLLLLASGLALVGLGVRLIGKRNPYLVIDDRGIKGGFGLIRWEEIERVRRTDPTVLVILVDPDRFRSRLRGWQRLVNAPYRGALELHLHKHSSRNAEEICEAIIERGQCVVEHEKFRLFGDDELVELFRPGEEEE